MKLYYFSYFIRKISTQEKLIHNISDLLTAYCKSNNNALKGSFKYGDEKLYLAKIDGYKNTYYFLKTNNNDLLKRINENSISVGDIKDKLHNNEKVAFTSHIHLSSDRSILAIASGVSCPRIDTFADYFNNLIKKLGLNDYEIEFTALTSNATKKDLLEMEVVNSIFVDVDADNGSGKAILSELFGDTNSGIGGFKITVESTQGNIKEALKKIINKKDKSGIVRIGAKAKHSELKGQLMDYWLDNENALSDKLSPSAKRKSLADQIGEKFDSNAQLQTLYNSFISNLTNAKTDTDANLVSANDQKYFDDLGGGNEKDGNQKA
ncbi:hypothetical protein L1267_14340 [Pseudoalteromonas sp. OFAV1]|uniref:hypothetical protein n=1 Tax=Pseudoalteromonas sp. OFAV1 TaxID=2908892 RepID=UPI001F1780DF|nr:hypothetical protein [Pseudoalteromonas sp. OFAV1]MCF2901556.1 hypothetical protein [Pseudoalteromonas sp. OFAV1]